MKIIITEEQLKMVKEAINVHRLNQILDKLADSGMESLTDDEKRDLDDMSTGKNVKKRRPQEVSVGGDDTSEPYGGTDDPDGYPGNNLVDMFMEVIPQDTVRITLNDEDFRIRKRNDKLLVDNRTGSIQMVIFPFYEGDKLKIHSEKMNGVYKISTTLPSNLDEMNEFVHTFFNQTLPGLINIIKRK